MTIFKPIHRKGGKGRKRRKDAGHRSNEAYDKAKLRASGLWDPAARRSRLVVTRVTDAEPPLSPQAWIEP